MATIVRGPRPRGVSMVELTIALAMMGALLAIAVPRFQGTLEQSRADVAGANLRAIWSAERLYWLANRAYAPDLAALQAAGLVDPSLAAANAPYAYAVAGDDAGGFTATATRAGSSVWSGALTLDADGALSGSVQRAGQAGGIVPGFQ